MLQSAWAERPCCKGYKTNGAVVGLLGRFVRLVVTAGGGVCAR
jgi:hypothetical protein